jgi:hypothetical protein
MNGDDLEALGRMGSGPRLAPKPPPPPIEVPEDSIDVELLRTIPLDHLEPGERRLAEAARQHCLDNPSYWYAFCAITKERMEQGERFGFKEIAESYRYGFYYLPDGTRAPKGKSFSNNHTAHIANFVVHFWPQVSRLIKLRINKPIDTSIEKDTP